MKYVTQEVVDAVIYEDGMEDGFNFYSLSGAFIKHMSKEEIKKRGCPRLPKKPTLYSAEGIIALDKGDYIVTKENGERHVYTPPVFNRLFTLLPE